MNFLIRFLAKFLNLLFPSYCFYCEQETTDFLCLKCKKNLIFNDHQLVNPKNLKKPYFDKLLVMSSYSDNPVLKNLIKSYKFKSAFDLSIYLSNLAKDYLEGFEIDYSDYVFTYVPLHWYRFWERGFNQSYLLSLFLNKDTQKLLKRVKYTKYQSLLKKSERKKNVKNVFSYTTKKIPQKVFLVDDVCSTLSTVNECAKVLKEAGVKEVIVFCLAKNF
jgi:ComF family protein